MNILLHICCAPCAIYPVEQMRKAGHRVAGLFYNPNIHPYAEYLKRKEALERYAAKAELAVVFAEYDPERYFQYVIYNEGVKKDRCPVCWWMRLQKTAQLASEKVFDAITTTLLASPYQEHDIIRDIGNKLCEDKKVQFYYQDFRVGFREAHETARSQGVYCQKYCGCLFSELERYRKKAAR